MSCREKCALCRPSSPLAAALLTGNVRGQLLRCHANWTCDWRHVSICVRALVWEEDARQSSRDQNLAAEGHETRKPAAVQESPQDPFGSASLTRFAMGEWNNMAGRAEHARCRAPRSAWGRPARRVLVTAATALTLSFVIGACASSPSQPSPSPTPTASLARLTITPASGSRSAKPQKGIAVKVSDGKIVSVKVETGSERVTGVLTAAATTWRSHWALNTATRYTVRATALDAAGRTVTVTSTFRTLTPAPHLPHADLRG